jgi:NADH dehydrogenase
MRKKRIVILGAGFAGLRTALDLAKRIKDIPGYEIILIDKRSVHMYTPDLYEIATAFVDDINDECLTELRETVAIKIPTIIKRKPITFIHDKVLELDPKKKTIGLKKRKAKLKYDHLVLALGSVSNYYGIPGLKQFSYPLKTVKHAIVINCHIDQYFQVLWKKGVKKEVNFVIGGGGATGVEFAGELQSLIKKLCKKYGYPRSKVKITLIQGSGELVGAGKSFSKKIEKRLKSHRVKIMLNTFITGAEAGKVTIKPKKGRAKKIPSDMMIWAGGVKPHPLITRCKLKCNKYGAVEVDEFLQAKHYKNTYAAGDSAEFIDPKTERQAPWLAQVAEAQGVVLAKNIIANLNDQPLTTYKVRIKGIIIPVVGRYAIFKSGGGKLMFSGSQFWLLRRLVDLRYALKLLPFHKAVHKWWHATNIFLKND